MASSGFSIDIGKLPPTEGLGQLAQGTQSQASSDTLAAGASQRSLTNTNTNTLSEPISPTHSHSQPHALSSVFGTTTQRASSPFSGSPTTSPGRHNSTTLRSRAPSTATASPRHLSPATSQIFERDVQEPNALSLAPELGSAVPGHVLQHDDYIPTVLDQSADVIADPSFSPDDIEIVMHKDHVPAVAVAEAAVSGSGGGGGGGGGGGSMSDSGFMGSPAHEADSPPPPNITSSLHAGDHTQTYSQTHSQLQSQNQQQQPSYGNVANSTDPRRLSFISFADVVHASQSDRDAYSSLPRSASPANLQPHPHPTQTSPNAPKQFASASSLGLGFNSDLNTPVRRSSASLAAGNSGAGTGRRGSVGLSVSGLRERAEMGESSPHVEAGLPHGEERGELMVESLRSAMGRERE